MVKQLATMNSGPSEVFPAKWPIGPPPPPIFTHFTRALELSTLLAFWYWVVRCLGGLGVSTVDTAGGGNDTSFIFNWHPFLMALVFPVLMAEAVLAYRVPLVDLER